METAIKRYEVTSMYHNGWKRKAEEIEELVIHGTQGKTANGLINWMVNGERAGEYKKGIALFHFLIGHLGELYQLAPIDRWYYHSSSKKHDSVTLGVELLNIMQNNEGAYGERQYVALEDLLFNKLIPACPNLKRIVSHDYNNNTYSGNRKNCPGVTFSWTRIRDLFKKKQIDLIPELFEDVIEFVPVTIKREV